MKMKMRMRTQVFCLALIVTVTCMSLLFLPGCRSTDPGPEILVKKDKNWDTIEVAPGFSLTNNMNATEVSTKQAIFQYKDGSYGWEWQRGNSDKPEDPNYPEVIFGVKPWGGEKFIEGGELPLQLKNIDSLLMEIDFDYSLSSVSGWWSVTVELWLTEDKPAHGEDITASITDEIMLLFDWQGNPVQTGNIIQDESYTYYLTQLKSNWGGGWDYSQFKIKEKGTIPEQVNLKLFLDFIQDELNRSGDLWLGALEFGMLYQDNTAGRARIKKLNYVINGTRVESGCR